MSKSIVGAAAGRGGGGPPKRKGKSVRCLGEQVWDVSGNLKGGHRGRSF